MDVTSVTPSEVHSVNNLREGDQLLGSRNNCNDGNNLNSIERLSLDVVNMKTRKLGLRTATWNVRSMWQAGKLDNVIQEMETMRLDILGLCETRWTGCGTIQKKNHTMMYAGGDVHARGVCIIIKKKLLRSVKGFWTVSDRVILMKIAAKPFDLCIIQVYAPTSECEMEEIESFYEQVENTMKQVKPSDILIIMGDLNAKVGRGRHGNVVGNWGLGKRNERGERLIEFAEKNSMCIMNTWFSQPARKLYTWSSPGDIYRNQIDYILIKTRFKTSIHKVRTYPGADCNSDHNPVVASIKIRLKKEKPKSDVKREVFDLSSLKVETVKRDFQIRLENKFSILESHDDNLGVEESIDKAYEEIVKNVAETVKETLPKKEKPAKQPWMNDKILAMMKERRRLKGNRKKYRSKDKEIRKACKEAEEEWLNARCKEIENLEETKQWRPMHQKIKELGGSKRSNSAGIQDKNGNIIFEEDKVAGRWVEYIQELFKDADRGDKTVIENQEGATILETEVRFAISSMLDNKAPGGDGLTTEVLKAMNDKGISRITKLLNDIYENGHVPEGLTESIFVQLPKKPATVKCEEYRTISLMSHLTKVLLKVIMNRSRKVIEEEISEEQYGFRKDKGTRDAIFNLRIYITINVHFHFKNMEQALGLSEEELKQRQIEKIDFINDRLKSNYFSTPINEDPKTCKSEKLKIGPLSKGWQDTDHSMMCAYKVVKIKLAIIFLRRSMEKKLKRLTRDYNKKYFLKAFCTADKWYGMKVEDLRVRQSKAVKNYFEPGLLYTDMEMDIEMSESNKFFTEVVKFERGNINVEGLPENKENWYTWRVIDLNSNNNFVPRFIYSIAPRGSLEVNEKSWNAYPFTYTDMDWNSCVICQERGGDLRCPTDSLQKNGLEVYTNFLETVDKFSELGILPVDVDFKEVAIAETFLENHAKWHKSCHIKFARSKLQRAQKQIEVK
ncbi:Craniofacial development protein 2 [Nymphon striatum]|nr:Craniofacial development protein 2 [Nymphon striatum]